MWWQSRERNGANSANNVSLNGLEKDFITWRRYHGSSVVLLPSATPQVQTMQILSPSFTRCCLYNWHFSDIFPLIFSRIFSDILLYFESKKINKSANQTCQVLIKAVWQVGIWHPVTKARNLNLFLARSISDFGVPVKYNCCMEENMPPLYLNYAEG